MTTADNHDYLNAFRAGYRHGADLGAVTPAQAVAALHTLGRPTDPQSVDCFCNGADDGARGDSYRYLLSIAVPFTR